MNILGIGVDILELERVATIRCRERFAEYFLTPSEMRMFAASKDPVRFVASRFAAKEAVIKAFPGALCPHEFEIIKDAAKPTVRFASEDMREYRAFVSISHSTDYVIGYAAVTGNEQHETP